MEEGLENLRRIMERQKKNAEERAGCFGDDVEGYIDYANHALGEINYLIRIFKEDYK